MHVTAKEHGRQFFEKYIVSGIIVDVGSLEVCNGSLREVAPKDCKYVGVDCCEGEGVDIVMTDPYTIPLPSSSVDAVVSTSTFEHVELFWVLFLEMVRIVKVGGLVYVNAPSNGPYHQFPVDCWRFYRDAGKALTTWANRNQYTLDVVETFVSEWTDCDVWKDWVCVWRKL